MESLFNKVTGLQAWNFTKKGLQHRRFPVKWLYFTLIRIHSFYHWLSIAVTHCHVLLFVVNRCHLLYHSLSLIAIHCTTRCHSLSLVVIRWATRCHSLSLDVPLICYFINDPSTSWKFSQHFAYIFRKL